MYAGTRNTDLKKNYFYFTQRTFFSLCLMRFTVHVIKSREELHYSSVPLANNRISLFAKSVGTIGHIDNYVCLTTFNPLKYKDAKHWGLRLEKGSGCPLRAQRGLYDKRFSSYTYTHITAVENQNRPNRNVYPEGWPVSPRATGECNANLDHNNSASQVFCPFLTLEAYFTSTGHNNVIYSRLKLAGSGSKRNLFKAHHFLIEVHILDKSITYFILEFSSCAKSTFVWTYAVINEYSVMVDILNKVF